MTIHISVILGRWLLVACTLAWKHPRIVFNLFLMIMYLYVYHIHLSLLIPENATMFSDIDPFYLVKCIVSSAVLADFVHGQV